MNHKSIMFGLAGVFCLGILSSIVSIFSKLNFYPEIFYAAIFALMAIICILFFKHEDILAAKNKRSGYVKVVDQNMIIGNEKNVQRKKLFLRVSIIAWLSKF